LKQIATIFSNDPQNPITKVSTIVSIKQYFDFEPSNRVLLQGYYGDTITKNVTITSHADQAVTIKSISSDIDSKIEYKLNTIKEGKEFGLEIKTRSGLKDIFRGKIILETNNQKKPTLELTVMSRVEK
jgi:hypothetical protein